MGIMSKLVRAITPAMIEDLFDIGGMVTSNGKAELALYYGAKSELRKHYNTSMINVIQEALDDLELDDPNYKEKVARFKELNALALKGELNPPEPAK